jgi:D-inositol-3-phosphate glycosyltransferase
LSEEKKHLNGLRWRLTAMRRLWAPGAQPSQTFLEPDRILREPEGKVDVPGAGAEVGPVFDVRGWALFPDSPTAQVEIRLGGRSLGRARLGHPRPDVRLHWEAEYAGSSGFRLTVDLAEEGVPKGAAELEVIATSIEGEELRIDPIPIEVDPRPEKKRARIEAPPLRTAFQDSPTRPHVLVVTHQLNLGGAQLYLLDLLKEMVRGGLASFTVLSPLDGEVRKEIEALGIPVHISSLVPYDDPSSHIGRLEEMIAWMEGREFDAVLVNTATMLASPGAEAAELLGLPVLWAIHESFPLTTLWADASPEIEERIAVAMRNSSALIFEAEATQRLYEPLAGSDRCVTLPYGLDLEPIDAARRDFDPAERRRAAGIPADAEVVTCIGTVEPRKAQLMLAHAFDVIASRHPAAHLVFVGGRDDLDSEYLTEAIEHSKARERMRLIPVTPDVEEWYGMADLLVSASDVESLPRTVLQAMAWETPVLATDVFGLPELITDGETGWLCQPRDLEALSEGLDRALSSSPEERARIARRSRALVEDRHSLPKYARAVSNILQDAIKNKRRSIKEAKTG